MARALPLLLLAALTMFVCDAAAAERASSANISSVGIPKGFDELTRNRQVVVDLYFGGRKIGDARAIVRPGYLRFEEPEQILKLVPNLEVSTEISAAFAADFPTNAGLVCSDGQSRNCGSISPDVAGLIFDEDRFRVDLFVNRKWLRLVHPNGDPYLPTPTAPLSLTSSTGLALSGASGSSPDYNLQNRTIIGFRNARIRAESSYASKFGFVADTLVGEVDERGMRYSAGLLWAPGLDLTGERRIVGAGFGTQFDTRADRNILEGTPIILFLAQPARVDILIDGRLVTSGLYDAGNNVVDTSTLPNGSYSVLLRIHESNGSVREERRFFAKNAQVAPVGQPIYFGYAGLLANTRQHRPVSISKDMFYQLGTARRLNNKLAVDVSVIGANKNPILEAGGWLITPVVRVRAAALASTEGDHGALLQIASSQIGGFSLNADLRRIWSHDGEPLIPLPTYVETFDSGTVDQQQLGNGSYTQASGSIGYQFGAAYLSLIGSLRKDKDFPVDYSVGPNFNWPILGRHGLQIALQADAQVTRQSTAGYVGVRLLFNRARYSVSSTVGARSLSDKTGSGSSRTRPVADTTAQYSYSDDAGTDLSVAGGLTRDIDSTTGHAEALLYSRLGSVRAQVLHGFEGSSQTQYGLSLQTSAVLDGHDAVVGGRDLSESALVVAIDGSTGDTNYDVIVNGQQRGRVKSGQKLPIFLEPYRAYSVALRPVNAASVWFDSAPRNFTLYPGNVQHLVWRVEPVVTIFGRALRSDGSPVADAVITSRRGIGQSNAEGYFQIETSANDVLSFESPRGSNCKVSVGALHSSQDFLRVGKVVCQ